MNIMVPEWLYNILGAAGAACILLGFYRTSVGKWQNTSLVYELDNMLGALLLISYQVHHKAYIGITLNVVWVTVALRGVVSYAERRGKPKRKVARR